MQHDDNLSNDSLPVSEALFTLLIRSMPQQARDLTSGMSDGQRARLALFCNARAHLREMGHVLAKTCSEEGLVREGGQAGRSLFAQARADVVVSNFSAKLATRPVTLARLARGAVVEARA